MSDCSNFFCKVVNYKLDIGSGYEQTGFNIFVVIMAMFGNALFLTSLVKWKQNRSHGFYFNRIILGIVAYFIIFLTYVMPVGNGAIQGFAYGQVANIAMIIALWLFWTIEVNVALFLFAKMNTAKEVGERHFLLACGITVPCLIAEIVASLLNIQWVVCTITEVVLLIFMLVVCFYIYMGRGLMEGSPPPRPAMKIFAGFMLPSHAVLAVNYYLFTQSRYHMGAPAMFLYIVGKLLFVGGFAPLLLVVIAKDTAYLRKDSARLLQYNNYDEEGGTLELDIPAAGSPRRKAKTPSGKGGYTSLGAQNHASAAGAESPETTHDGSGSLLLEAGLYSPAASARGRGTPGANGSGGGMNSGSYGPHGSGGSGSGSGAAEGVSADPLYCLMKPGMRIKEADLEISKQIGGGQFGDVFLAKLRGKDTVAAKRFRTVGKVPKEKLIEGFSKEVCLLASLEHPNVVSFVGAVFDAKDDDDSPPVLMLVTEFVEGGSLFDFLGDVAAAPYPERAFPGPQRLSVLRDVARGMAFLHSRKPVVMHRDLKSHNLLLTGKPGTAKVCDFGISRVKEITQTMTSLGTPQWMAPETIRGERYSEKADVFSFGVVAWEVISLERPFPNVQPLRVASLVAFEHIRLPIPPTATKAIANLINSCWSESPHKRPTFAAILDQLDRLETVLH